MRYISLFSGVEAASVAWGPLGWEPVCFCEVDEFPSAVLAHRFPDVPNLGDVTKVDWSDVYERFGAVDVLVGGSPCQSFSIAGNREGLSGESGLMFEYIRAIRDLLQASGGGGPRYILWENVPGALSSEKGVAFGQLLAELDELGYGLAWRVLDAQYVRVPDRSAHGFFGPVAQRRRRVFLIGVLGSPHAAEILFERESLRWDHPKGREAREALAEDTASGAGIGGSAGCLTPWDNESKRVFSRDGVMGTIYAAGRSGQQQQSVLTPWDVQSKRIYSEDGTAPCLQSGSGEGMTIQPIVLQGDGSSSNGSQNGCGYNEDGSAYTLNGRDRQSVCIQGSMVGREDKNGPQGSGVNDDVSFTLNTTDRHAVAFAQNTRDEVRIFQGDGQVVGALAAQPGMKQTSYICMQDGQANGTNGTPVVCVEECISDIMFHDDCAPTQRANQYKQPAVVCMQDGQANGTICEDGTSTTLNASHEQPIIIDRAAFNQGENAKYPPPYRAERHDGHAGGEGSACCMPSNGEQVVGPLCARDWKGVGSQYVSEGKVICERR